jgi:sulfatase modifying factor 1
MTPEKMEKEGGSENREPMVVVPDDFSEIDHIGYIEHSAGLVEMIRSIDARGSFTIGVFGQWGQGKTSMLRQIERQLNETAESETGKEGILTVWFNPWQFSGEEHIIIPFFHTLVSYIEDFKKAREGSGSKIIQAVGGFLKELADVPVALAYGLEGKVKIPLLLESKFGFKEAIEESRRRKEERQERAKTELKKAVDQYESLYYRLISRLQKASQDLNLKIVVFIDDLDRCLPEKAVELLEGIKVLLDIPGFVFVIGVAREVIERGIRVRYRELYRDQPQHPLFLEQEYLDKIVQFPFTLPPPDSAQLQALVAGYLKNLSDVKPYLSTIHRALGVNPRSLKRFVNNLSYTFWVADRKMKSESTEEKFLPELLVKMALIAFRFPRLYQVIGRTPGHLLRIQDFLRARAEEREKQREAKSGPEEGAAGVGAEEGDRLQDEAKKLNEFIGITELNLFERPQIDSISAILAVEERKFEGKKVEDEGFKDKEEVRRYVSLLTVTAASEKAVAAGGGDVLHQTMASRMESVPGGRVKMQDEKSGNTFTAEVKSFMVDKYPVTQDLYREVTGQNPSRFEGDDRPVETVSWFEAVQFCNLLSDRLGLDRVYTVKGEEVNCNRQANGFRLPTEAEWEYACRAGTTGDRYGDLDEIAWYDGNSNDSTQGVGQKRPNGFGLYDMLGNVWEWCWDWYGEYPEDSKKEWHGPSKGAFRVLRGGSWFAPPDACRCAYRYGYRPAARVNNAGVRLARSL